MSQPCAFRGVARIHGEPDISTPKWMIISGPGAFAPWEYPIVNIAEKVRNNLVEV